MKPDGSCVTSPFWGNNRQHWPVCAKTISSWISKVLFVAKAHMSLSSLWGWAAASAALAAGVSLVYILQAGDWARVSTPGRHYFSTYITIMDQHQDSVQHAVLGSVRRSSPGKRQTLMYTQSWVCYLWFPKVTWYLDIYGSLPLVVFGPIVVTYLILPLYMSMQMV